MTKLISKKQEIKNRKDLINKGEVPAGYKNSWGYVYPEEWDLSTLNSLCSKVQKKNKDNAQLQVLTNSATKGVILQEEYFDREIVNNENTDGYYIVEAGDFMYNPRISAAAPAGPINRNNLGISGIASPLYSIFRAKQTTNTNFIERYFESSFWHGYMKRVSNQGARHDRLNLLDEDFYKMPIPQPKVEEQEKIAEILSCCDKVIELKEQLIKHYYEKRNFIIGYFLKNIKSKNIVKLGDICEMFSGGTPSVENRQYYNNGTIPFIKSGEIENDKTEDYITEDGLKNSSAKLVKEGDLLVALYGANSGNVALSKISGAINQAILCIRSSFIDCYYLLILLKFNKDRIIQKYLQGGQGNLSAQIIKSLKFKIPTIEEQKKIVTIISNIDKELKLLEQELEQYKQLKKALSQLLLTGIVRVNEV